MIQEYAISIFGEGIFWSMFWLASLLGFLYIFGAITRRMGE